MPVSESNRNLVYQAFTSHWSTPVAEVVMELLFTQPTTDLATQQDIHANTTLLRADMGELRAELTGDMTELRGEMAELRAELKGEMAELRGELKGEAAELRGEMAELRGDLKAEVGNLYRWGAGVIMANGIAVVTALVT